MIKVRFIHEGRHKGWRYKEGDVVLLPDNLGQLALDEGMAVRVIEKQYQTNRNFDRSEKRSLT